MSARSIGQGTADQAAPSALVAQPQARRGCTASATPATVYIGRAVNLRRRVGSDWTRLAGHLTERVSRIARVEAVRCSSQHEASWLERNLLEQRLPRWNKTPAAKRSRSLFAWAGSQAHLESQSCTRLSHCLSRATSARTLAAERPAWRHLR